MEGVGPPKYGWLNCSFCIYYLQVAYLVSSLR